jgi:hypothetical protein
VRFRGDERASNYLGGHSLAECSITIVLITSVMNAFRLPPWRAVYKPRIAAQPFSKVVNAGAQSAIFASWDYYGVLKIVQSLHKMRYLKLVFFGQCLFVLLGVVSVARSQPGPRYGDKYGERDYYGDTGPDPRKAYDFNFQTQTQGRREASNLNGDVRGRYNYLDDLGELYFI